MPYLSMPSVRIYLPADGLQGYVTFYYVVEASEPVSDFLYPEWGNLRFAVTGEWYAEMAGIYPLERRVYSLFGPTDRCGRVTCNGGKTVGLGVTPIGWHRLFGSDANLMANRVRPYAGELGVSGDEVIAAFAPHARDQDGVEKLNSLLAGLVERCPLEDPLAVRADRVLRTRPADVSTFAAAVGVSERSLHRICLRTFGFPPKRLLRRQRFLDTLGQYRSAVGASLETSLDEAYNDQPHFYRDFRDFMNMSPKAYFRAERRLMAEAAIAQQTAGVTLSFQLPPI